MTEELVPKEIPELPEEQKREVLDVAEIPDTARTTRTNWPSMYLTLQTMIDAGREWKKEERDRGGWGPDGAKRAVYKAMMHDDLEELLR